MRQSFRVNNPFNVCFSDSCGSVVEHCVSSANSCGFKYQGTHTDEKMYKLNVSHFG